MKKLSVRDIEVHGRRLLVRVDFNVPLNAANGEITDDSRIQAALPTIHYLIDKGAKIILCSHLGRPGGRVVEGLRLGAIARRLSRLLGQEVRYSQESVGKLTEEAAGALKPGEVMLLENLRFYPGEEENSPSFSAALAGLADVFVDDAFATAHRSHASIVGIAAYLPAVAGMLLEKELTSLGQLLENPAHPFAILLGGAKTADKAAMLDNIMDRVNYLLIGGGMAASFLEAGGMDVGESPVGKNRDTVREIVAKARHSNVKIVLPNDVMVAENGEGTAAMVAVDKIPASAKIVDIGRRTIESFTAELEGCQTVFWNGPMGIYENEDYAGGTKAMARVLAGLPATTIIGGGSTAEIVIELKLAGEMSFVSTGGGASLRFLSGEELPGVAVLMDRVQATVKKG